MCRSLRVPVADFRARLNASYPSPVGLRMAVPSMHFTVYTQYSDAIVDAYTFQVFAVSRS